jgi:hypothetical protein
MYSRWEFGMPNSKAQQCPAMQITRDFFGSASYADRFFPKMKIPFFKIMFEKRFKMGYI